MWSQRVSATAGGFAPSRKVATSAASTFISVSRRPLKRRTMTTTIRRLPSPLFVAVLFVKYAASGARNAARGSQIVKSNDPRRDCCHSPTDFLVYTREFIEGRRRTLLYAVDSFLRREEISDVFLLCTKLSGTGNFPRSAFFRTKLRC